MTINQPIRVCITTFRWQCNKKEFNWFLCGIINIVDIHCLKMRNSILKKNRFWSLNVIQFVMVDNLQNQGIYGSFNALNTSSQEHFCSNGNGSRFFRIPHGHACSDINENFIQQLSAMLSTC